MNRIITDAQYEIELMEKEHKKDDKKDDKKDTSKKDLVWKRVEGKALARGVGRSDPQPHPERAAPALTPPPRG